MDRFIVKRTDGFMFQEKYGYSMVDGYGIYDTNSRNFIADLGCSFPWSYRKKKTAQIIVDQFNKIGPCSTLHFSVILREAV